MCSIISYLNTLIDSRKTKGIRHQQTPTLVIMIISMMCGYTSFNAMARFAKNHKTQLASRIPLPRGKVPSASTFLRLSHCHDAQQNFVSLVSFFGHQSQLVLRTGILENNKQSEIHQVQALLSLFKVEKALFTLDALH